MTAEIFDGHALARALIARTAEGARRFAAAKSRKPCLAALLCTDDPGALAYWERIATFAEEARIDGRLIRVRPDELVGAIARLNGDDGIDALLPLAPVPPEIGIESVAAILSPEKDADGLTPLNAGRLARQMPGLYPCTAQAAIALARDRLGSLRGRNAIVVGASVAVGRPLAEMLLQQGATVTIAHADSRDLAASCRDAELLFSAVGKPGLIGAAHLRPSMTVIDIGINRVTGADGAPCLVGDVDLSAARNIVAAISAVPDGVGPLTTAFLVNNTLRAAMSRAKIGEPLL